MLRHLSIQHYALIEQLDIAFGPRLNIMTGETGSGKSIVLGAMSLLLGERADLRVVQEGKTKCVVEGTFSTAGLGLEPLFVENDLDFDEPCLLRREILASGKSRAFINDTPVNLKVMREVAMRLIDIHSQHQTLQINDPLYQLNILDRFAQCDDLRGEYTSAFAAYRHAKVALEDAVEQDRLLRNNLDFLRFQHKELDAAQLDGIDQLALEEELNMLSNADEISGGLGKALNALSEGEVTVSQLLREAIEGIGNLSNFARQYEELDERLQSAEIELDDVAREVEALLGKVEVDPQRLARLEAQQGNLFKLEQKHGVEGVEALRELRDSLKQKVNERDNFDELLEQLREVEMLALKDVRKHGEALRAMRKKAGPAFGKEIAKLLKALNMPNATLEVKLEALAEPGPNGLDKAVFYFSANAGHKPAPLREVASGGELSRLMLAIKHISSAQAMNSTIVFDEIDTGVSGEVAHSMGRIMQGMGEGMQVICITHLPQIAAKGEAHYKVYKEIREGRTITDIVRLDEEERIQEIAQMLSGAKTTDASLKNARELLANH